MFKWEYLFTSLFLYRGKQKLTENYELKDVNDDDNVHSAEEGNHVSDWSTFWGETNPEEANLIKSKLVLSFDFTCIILISQI